MTSCAKEVCKESRYGQGSFLVVRNKWWNRVGSVLLSAWCLCKLALFLAWDHGLLTFLDAMILPPLKPSMLLKEQCHLFFFCFPTLYLFISSILELSLRIERGFFKENSGHKSEELLLTVSEFWQQLWGGLAVSEAWDVSLNSQGTYLAYMMLPGGASNYKTR